MSEDINVGAISEALNNKVDLNQMNTNTQGLSYASGWGMPSSKYNNLTFGASGTTYTAPANGWFCFYRIPNDPAGYCALTNTTNGFITETRNTISKAGNGTWIPARKNDVIRLTYDGSGTTTIWRFYYAEGEK